jgi:glycosyltransferase involved in cell wall biosynthesis
MESLDVFVMPSFTEGTSNSIVEAMACGKPIIAAEVGSIPHMIGGDTGILVPPGNKRALAEAMLRFADNDSLRKETGALAKQGYQKLF